MNLISPVTGGYEGYNFLGAAAVYSTIRRLEKYLLVGRFGVSPRDIGSDAAKKPASFYFSRA